MRPVALGVALFALVVSLAALAGSPRKAAVPEESSPSAVPAPSTPLVADKSRIDPVQPASKAAEAVERLPGLSSADEKKTLVVQKEFEMQLAASEPNVADPVDAAFDEAGRMYVAEFKSYPYSEEVRIPQQPTPIGKHNACLVRRLEDKDGDGVFETSTVFADQLSWVMSVACFDGGVFVLAPPHLY